MFFTVLSKADTEVDALVSASFGFVLRSPNGSEQSLWAKPKPLLPFLFKKKSVSQKKRNFNIRRYKNINENNRTEILNFRVSKEEKRIIEDKAFIKYDTLAPYLRDCALDKEILVIPGLSGIQDELNAIGNNLNQLTRAVNSGMCSAVDLSEMRKEVAGIWQLLNSALQKYLLV